MKRFIGLIVIFIVYFGISICAEVNTIYNALIGVNSFFESVLNSVRNFYSNFAQLFSNVHLDFIKENLTGDQLHPLIYAGLIFIAFSIVYLLVFGIIVLIQKHNRKKRLRNALQNQQISLTEEEKAKFEWRLYEKRFPGWRMFFLLIELCFLVGLFFLRYDEVFNGNELGLKWFNEVVDANASNNLFHFDYYSFFGEKLDSVGFHLANFVGIYIKNVANRFFTNSILEIIVYAIAIVLILSILWLIGTIPSGFYRKHRARIRARKAKQKYVKRLEDIEYKAWVRSKKENRISEKNRTLYNDNVIDTEVDNHVDVIAESTNKQNNKEIKNQTPEQNYIDDISTGVTDLGVIEEDNNELQKPLSRRETRFVGDEETDIILEEEPVIETIEEEDSYYNDSLDDKEETFEKYQVETTLNIEDKVKKYNVDVIDENNNVKLYNDEQVPTIVDYEDREVIVSTLKNNNEEKVNKLKEYVKPLIIDKKIQEKKSIKPIEIINNEQTKEYIVKTSNSESLSMSEEEKNIPSRHINRTKASALSKRKVNNKVLIKKGTKKLTSAKKQQLEEEKITKPTKPLDVEVK